MAQGRCIAVATSHDVPDRRTTILGILLLAALVVQSTWMLNVYPHWKETNSTSRVYLTLAIVERGTFQIDECIQRYGEVFDKALYDDHYYTDKAPGTSFLFVPIVWMLHMLGVVDLPVTFYCLRITCVTLPTIGFWLLTLRWFRQWSGREDRAIALVAAGALGTNFFIFSTQLFAHVPAAWFLFLSFLAIRKTWIQPFAGGQMTPTLLAGGLAGLAFLNDYIVMLAVAALGVASAVTPRINWRQPCGFGLGLVPSIAVWMAYNWTCFDHPLRTGFYYHAAERYGAAYQSGLLGMQPIDWSAPIGMLFSPARGMLFLSPFLIFAPLGWCRQIRSGAHRIDAVISATVVACLFLFTMTTIDWRGGWGFGTRYLVPAVPFLLVGVAGAVRDCSATSATSIVYTGLASVGVLLCGLAAATVPVITQESVNPLFALDWPLARDGYFAPHLFSALSDSWMAMFPYFAAMGIALFLLLVAGTAHTWMARLGGMLTSATVAGVVIIAQYNIPESSSELLAEKLTRIESLVTMGFLDQAMRETLDLTAETSSTDNPVGRERAR